MNPNKCPTPKTPKTTVVYRTSQDVIDHVVIPAIKGAGLNPDHYNLDGYTKDWIIKVDHHNLYGYFNTVPNIPGIIDSYLTATKARDLKVGDVVQSPSGLKTVVATSGEFLYGNEDCVVIVLLDESVSTYPTTVTISSDTIYETVKN